MNYGLKKIELNLMYKVLATFCVAMLLTGCDSASEKVMMHSIDGKWEKNAAQRFDFEINDLNPRNIIFVVRNNDDYPYNNLRLIVNFKNEKTQKTKIDTLNYFLAKPNGEWLGSGFGETKEILFQYKMNEPFSEIGKYSITVKQAMRKDVLHGIEDFGLKIETAKP
jgi:gliding motility-associated lipoprotein GldH